MATNISSLIHRVASTCLTLPFEIQDEEPHSHSFQIDHHHHNLSPDEEDQALAIWQQEEEKEQEEHVYPSEPKRSTEMEALMAQVFDAVSSMKRAYADLQAAHCPWDPAKMRAADAAVVSELRRLARLRDRLRRGNVGAAISAAAPPLREVVAPYEAAMEELRREIKAKEAEVESLKEKLVKKKARFRSGRRFNGLKASVGAATPELFEATMEQVKESSKCFTSHLLSLIRSARWDLATTARALAVSDITNNIIPFPAAEPHHAKHALESYILRRIFQGFENETFYIEGTLTSLLHPTEFRRDRYAQFRDMRGMDPGELLGILPTCQFGRFAARKYLGIVSARMEEGLFGGVEQRQMVAAGGHPRTGFYGEFLRLAKAVWMLHLLAFAMDPAPSQFEASQGAEYQGEYMESVVKLGGGGGRGVAAGSRGLVVGFSVAPGFKLGNGAVVKTRVYLTAKSERMRPT